jgi:hypothetical protein
MDNKNIKSKDNIKNKNLIDKKKSKTIKDINDSFVNSKSYESEIYKYRYENYKL